MVACYQTKANKKTVNDICPCHTLYGGIMMALQGTEWIVITWMFYVIIFLPIYHALHLSMLQNVQVCCSVTTFRWWICECCWFCIWRRCTNTCYRSKFVDFWHIHTHTHLLTHTHAHNHFMTICLGIPGLACIRRDIHPLIIVSDLESIWKSLLLL